MPRPSRIVWMSVAALAVLLPVEDGRAAWPHDPDTNLRISRVPGDTYLPAACPDGAGGTIVAWQQCGATCDIYAQRIRADGILAWGATGTLVCAAAGNQYRPTIGADGSGGGVVVWFDDRVGGHDVYAQRVDSTGASVWAADGVPLCTAAGYQYDPVIVAADSGAMIVAWWDTRNPSNDIYAQRVSANGQPTWVANGVALCAWPATQQSPAIAADGSGGAIAVWKDARTGGLGLYAQHVDRAGIVRWTVGGVGVCTTTGYHLEQALLSDGLGGVFIVWQGTRSGAWAAFDIWAQRLSAGGQALWATDGIPVSAVDRNQLSPRLTSDGSGGAIVAWRDYRGVDLNIYAQRMDASGTMRWTPDGVPVCTAAFEQGYPDVVSDGSGGAIIAWHDFRFQSWDIFAQRLDSAGSALWSAGGLPVSSHPGYSELPMVVSDGVGGVIVSWHDQRDGNWTVYGQRINPRGRLAGEEPVITGVNDVLGDEGGRVVVEWAASFLDAAPGSAIASYVVREETDSPPGWLDVGTVAATGDAAYTLETGAAIASPDSSRRSVFLVVARHVDGVQQWASLPDSGSSIDNLAPAMPQVMFARAVGNQVSFGWARNAEPDLARYRIYRGTAPDFAPSPATLVAETTDTTFSAVEDSAYVHKLSAVDVHGNESPPATLTPGDLVAVSPLHPPEIVVFDDVRPNPSTGPIRFLFSLPTDANVRLDLFDVQGRLTRSLSLGRLRAGTSWVDWDGRSADGTRAHSGLYWARLRANRWERVRTIVLLR